MSFFSSSRNRRTCTLLLTAFTLASDLMLRVLLGAQGSPYNLSYEPPGPSSRRTGLAFTEIMYHPREGLVPGSTEVDLEFIEIYNSNPYFEDLSGWRITGEVDFVFPPGTRLEAQKYLVVASQPERLREQYGLTNLVGPWSGRLANDRGSLRLRKKSGAIVLDLQYADADPWPVAADGAGHSLVLARPSYGEADPRAWAASFAIGGSPGGADALPTGPLERVVINEILASSQAPARDFIELHNHSSVEVDVSGCWLTDDPATNKFRIPTGTRLEPGGFMSFDADQLGFSLSDSGETVYLIQPDERRVIDVRRFGAQALGSSWGRIPDGAPEFRELALSTPGAPNSMPLNRPVVINEIFFHPPYGMEENEFIELHNRSNLPVDLTGWKFVSGIDFTFQAGVVLAGGEYLAVARNRTNLLASHPDLSPDRVVGNYAGTLADTGERVALAMPVAQVSSSGTNGPLRTNIVHVVVNEVTYGDGGRWGRWADGGGSSLELVDPRSDNHWPSNWEDSDESGKSAWVTVERTAPLTMQHPGVARADQLQVMSLDTGEALLDDVEVISGTQNLVRNGRFDTGKTNWVTQGTHRLSFADNEGTNSMLHIVASGRGDHVANRIRNTLTAAVPNNSTATLRARARWLRGHPELLMRLKGNALEVVGTLPIPRNLGTPGRRNSRARENAGPAINEVSHSPVLPKAMEPLRVYARVTDVDAIGQVEMVYRLDPSTNTTTLEMLDDGTGADELAGDGVFTVSLPGQPSGRLIAFQVRATDVAGTNTAVTLFPNDAPARECLVRFGDAILTNSYGTYRLWMTGSAITNWAAREKMSNEDLSGTFVYGTNRVIYGMGAHYSGSSYTAPTYTSPVGALCGYDLNFPNDDRLLGETQATLDWPIRDDTAQREQLMFWFLDQYQLPNMYRRFVNVYVNGLRRGTIYEDVQQPGGDTIGEFFSDDDEGSLWKTDCWNEFDDAGNRTDPCVLNTLEKFPATGPKNVARYRWNWRPRAIHSSANDFSDLFGLVDAVNVAQNYQATVESVVDVEHWMRTFAMNDLASFWDGFGNPNAKNTFLYKPQQDGWKLFSWDFDVGLGVFNDPPTAPLFEVGDPVVARMMQNPAWLRLYWESLQEGMNGFFQLDRINPILDSKYNAFRSNNITMTSPAGIKTWITQRRTYLQTQLNRVFSQLKITLNGGNPVVTDRESVTLTGIAPVAAHSLKINGLERRVNWSTVTNWNVSVGLSPGTNQIVVEGFDRFGVPVTNGVAGILIFYSGTATVGPRVIINEWMAANQQSLADPADGMFDDWFELYNDGTIPANLAGYSLTDRTNTPGQFIIPTGFVIPPKGFLLVWADGQPAESLPGGDLHVNFKLDANGESIALFDASAHLVDMVTYGPQDVGVSSGKFPDGVDGTNWLFPKPTPRGPNTNPENATDDFRITEARLNAAGLVELTWRTVPGRTYQLRTTTSLGATANWVLETKITAVGALTTLANPTPPSGATSFIQVVEVR